MKNLSIMLVAASLALGVAACGKDKGGEAGGASCDAVVAKMTTVMGKQMAGQVPAEQKALADKMQAKMSEVMLVSCKEDKWPEEVMTCVMAANDDKAMDECGDKGGKEFEDKLRKRMEPVMAEMMKEMQAAMGAPGGAAPPAAAEGAEEAEEGAEEGEEGAEEGEEGAEAAE